MRVVNVALGQRSYPILIGKGLLDRVGIEIRKLGMKGRCAVISDSNVARRYGKRATDALKAAGFDPVLIRVKPGEQSKSISVAAECYDQLAQQKLERRSPIIALGGGVVGDLAGFVASTYLRGVPFVQIPSTLLAQVDSSVGGKVGVNLKAGKNLVGSFYQPRLVLCDLSLLQSLPRREYISGLAEVIKYGVIYDAKLFALLERRMDSLLAKKERALAEVIARCCEIKAEIVSQDENEGGLRAILNFGHTVGHAIEAVTGYGKFLHGEAISLGQIIAARLSEKAARLPASDSHRIESLLGRASLPVRTRLAENEREQLVQAMALDKKVIEGEIRFVLADRIGKARWGKTVPRDLLEQSMAEILRCPP